MAALPDAPAGPVSRAVLRQAVAWQLRREAGGGANSRRQILQHGIFFVGK